MTVQRFVAPTAREALRRVKEQLGPDAIIVANKAVPAGVEITAMSAESLDALSTHGSGRPLQAPKPVAPAERFAEPVARFAPPSRTTTITR